MPAFLAQLFPAVCTTRFDAAHINDHLDAGIVPTRGADESAIFGREFMSIARCERRHYGTSDPLWPVFPRADAFVTITGANVAPDNPPWSGSQASAGTGPCRYSRRRLTAPVYTKHGTSIETRLTVIDRVPADDVASFPHPRHCARPADLARLGLAIRSATSPNRGQPDWRRCRQLPALQRPEQSAPTSASVQPAAVAPAVDLVATEVAYEPVDWTPTDAQQDHAMRCMKPMRCSRSGFWVRSRIRPSSCNRRRWLPSHRPSRPTGRICRQMSSPMACCRTPSSRHHLCRRGAFRVSRGLLDGRCDL